MKFPSCLLLAATSAWAQSVSGLWDATAVINQVEIPFRIEFAGEGDSVKGWFFNGDEKVTSTSGSLKDGRLTLAFDHYATRLEATVQEGRIEGRYGRSSRGLDPFTAVRHVAGSSPVSEVPRIGGLWEVGVKSPKGESAWRLIVRQNGADVSAAILRVDGDTGTLTGSFKDGKFILSHFSGARPSLLVLTPNPDGSLELDLSGKGKMTALRPAAARAKGLEGPTDPARHTTVKDPSEPFRFRFPDLNGNVATESDPRFQGKVLVINITGSWCPNCHDEAPFLAEIYRKYRKQGLEVIAISFEEAEQLKDPARLRAFIGRYGLEYTVLLGGEPAELKTKIPQAVNLNSWPTTFFLGRDGRVRHIHAGFPGKASGELHAEAKQDFAGAVEALLAEPIRSSR